MDSSINDGQIEGKGVKGFVKTVLRSRKYKKNVTMGVGRTKMFKIA
jgi:hypothetical protein